MFYIRKVKLVLALSILFILISTTVSGQVQIVEEIEEKITGISEEEKEILESLFILAQEIEVIERQQEEIAIDVDKIKGQIEALEKEILNGQLDYNNKRNVLKDVLKSYQRSGAGSYLKIMLESDNLTDFIRRVNILRDLSRNTERLLDSINESQKKLVAQKLELSHKIQKIEQKNKEYIKLIEAKKLLIDDKEQYLTKLKEQRGFYQEHLNNIQELWNNIKPYFVTATNEFSKIIEEGKFPSNAIKLKFNIFNIKGIIYDETFNDIITKNPHLSQMEFTFLPDSVRLEIPEKNIVLNGNFVILEGTTLKFEAEEGSFYDMALKQASINELFKEGYLMLNLKPLLFGTKINSIESKDAYIELIIK